MYVHTCLCVRMDMREVVGVGVGVYVDGRVYVWACLFACIIHDFFNLDFQQGTMSPFWFFPSQCSKCTT